MKICVYGAASNDIGETFLSAGHELGCQLAGRGHSLIFGGGDTGMMGAVARGAHDGGGQVTGIAPSFFNTKGILYQECDDFIYTETMRERKQLLDDMSDAFVITPGGIGTFDEFFEIYTLRQLATHKKPIAIYNTNGYYNPLIDMLNNAIDKKFMPQENMDFLFISDNPQEIIKHIENYNPADHEAAEFKFIK